MKFYLCKWIPPRPDFLSTMTDSDKKYIQLHGDYMNQLLKQGIIVAHGPVIDRIGGYGVSLYQIADDQEITDFTSRDPIILHGIGHYEHFNMLSLKF